MSARADQQVRENRQDIQKKPDLTQTGEDIAKKAKDSFIKKIHKSY